MKADRVTWMWDGEISSRTINFSRISHFFFLSTHCTRFLSCACAGWQKVFRRHIGLVDSRQRELVRVTFLFLDCLHLSHLQLARDKKATYSFYFVPHCRHWLPTMAWIKWLLIKSKCVTTTATTWLVSALVFLVRKTSTALCACCRRYFQSFQCATIARKLSGDIRFSGSRNDSPPFLIRMSISNLCRENNGKKKRKKKTKLRNKNFVSSL